MEFKDLSYLVNCLYLIVLKTIPVPCEFHVLKEFPVLKNFLVFKESHVSTEFHVINEFPLLMK